MNDNKKLLKIIERMAEVIEQNKEYLTELDNVIGDGDHGINMARGFSEVMKKLPSLTGVDVSFTLKTVGIILVSTVGGASGPLYGTAFMNAGAAVTDAEEIGGEELIKIFDAFIAGIMKRGKSTVGEKTMLDAIVPARDAFVETYESTHNVLHALENAVHRAKEGVEQTKGMIATKGRASYLGERSIGHQDPGATSIMLLLETLKDCLACMEQI